VLLAGAAAAGAMPRRLRAEDKVFLNYTQGELDRAYDQSAWAPNAAAIQAGYAADSASVRKSYRPHTFKYGPTEAEVLDVFGPGAGRGPIHVFVHGGAWRGLSKDDGSFAAPTFVDSGGVYIALSFANFPAVGVAEMVEQCRGALRWVHANAASFGGNADRISLSGHASGAHLAALVLATDWASQGLPPDLIKSALLMSGIYDLHPLVLSSRRDAPRLTPESAEALSPIRHLDRLRCPVTIAWGDLESPEFKRQGMVFADAVLGMGLQRSRFVLFDTNHFQVPLQLARPDTPLGRAALAMMGLV
jgi:arylformamidase